MTSGVRDRTRRRAFGVIAAVAVMLPLASTANAHAPGTSADFFGVNGGYLRPLTLPDRAARLDAVTASMGRQGISWARLVFDQSVEERQRNSFDWYVPDTMIAALARHGVRGAAAFVGTAAWADDPFLLLSCGNRAYPHDVAGWADWVAAAARRYGPSGTFWRAHPALPELPIRTWEIGNEPNLKIFWCPKANPEQYAYVYTASVDAIAAVDPDAQVIVGGLAPNFGTTKSADVEPVQFLARMLAAQPSLRTRIPAVGVHPYTRTSDGLGGVLDMIVRFREAMVAAGLPSTPMVANEYGWYTRPQSGLYYTTEAQRAGLIGGTANSFWRTNCGVSGMAPHAWVTAEANNLDPENWYGLANPWTGEPHPSGIAYADQIRLALDLASSPPPQGTLDLCPTADTQDSGSQSGTTTEPEPPSDPLLPSLPLPASSPAGSPFGSGSSSGPGSRSASAEAPSSAQRTRRKCRKKRKRAAIHRHRRRCKRAMRKTSSGLSRVTPR
jgi:hypothetical protein